MYDGEKGLFEAFVTHPANLFTGTFIGEPPMKVFPETLSINSRTVNFDIAGGAALAHGGEAA